MVENLEGKQPVVKSKTENKKEWREHYGASAEAAEEREKKEKLAKRAEKKEQKKEWQAYFGPLTEVWGPAVKRAEKESGEAKKVVEKATIPPEGIGPEVILGEARQGAQNAEVENQQRTEKISVLQEAKKVGEKRLKKLFEGLSYLAGADRVGLFAARKGKNLAVEGGRWLAIAGVSQAAAFETVGRGIAGRLQERLGVTGAAMIEAKIKTLKSIPEGERPGWWQRGLKDLEKELEEKQKQLLKGLEKLNRKGKILNFLHEKLWK